MNTLATLALIFSPTAFVANAPMALGINQIFSAQPADGASLMDQIVERYNAGTEVDFPSAIGWWTGRCYLAESPNQPFGVARVVA
jgi:hypothetical protein